MLTLTLMEKVPKDKKTEAKYAVTQFLNSVISGLNVTFRISELSEQGRLTIRAEGEDLEVFKNFLNENFGLAPPNIEALKTNENLLSFVSPPDEDRNALVLDLGLPSSDYLCILTADSLKTTLANGKKISLNSLTDLFCLREGFPLFVKIVNIDENMRTVNLELSSHQVSVFKDWILSLNDRIMVVGATRRQLKNTFAKTGNLRDITEIERLGFFSHSVPCKLGLNPNTLIQNLKSHLSQISIYHFDSRKIFEELGPYT
ncbi:MAG: DUF2110 family protein [Candidatus Bathyarchaeota archaeon]